jgi:hypothetical protein
MSIPLDRLYNYIDNMSRRICSGPVDVYRFYPHGSKKIQDLTNLNVLTEEEFFTSPEIYCNDQEPLNYDLYTTGSAARLPTPEILEVLARKGIEFPRLNFRGQVTTIWDQAILLHSETRSAQVEQYRSSQFIPAYYWCHAVIALDWFRYAQHVAQHKQVSKTFLIYNRAWTGTREYRLRFAELLITHGINEYCKTSICPVDSELGVHYNLHKFKNPTWQPTQQLENFFPLNTAPSHYSADFDLTDYQATDIEVVLETLFDDSRLHLTEKSLRPIACAQPFILASTHGALEYLRGYGFKTFRDIWDESYDQVEDPQERLLCLVDLMQKIADWPAHVKQQKIAQARTTAEYNRKHFFSKEFFNLIHSELETNLAGALDQLERTNTAGAYLHRYRVFRSDSELFELVKNSKKTATREKMLDLALWYQTRHLRRTELTR